MENVYHEPGLWHSWMYSNDEGFRDHIPPLGVFDLQGAVLAFYTEHADIIPHLAGLLRDAVDGRIDDRDKARALYAELTELLSAGHALCMALNNPA